jgi:hypothetical protein
VTVLVCSKKIVVSSRVVGRLRSVFLVVVITCMMDTSVAMKGYSTEHIAEGIGNLLMIRFLLPYGMGFVP